MSTATKPRVTPEQYLAAERLADEKHEYLDGEVIPKSGVSREHNLITGNIFAALRTQLRGRGEVYVADIRAAAGPGRAYTYPDVMAVAEPPRFLDAEVDTLLNPSLIVEVLSQSTELRDRVEKFAQYRSVGSMRDYLLVAQDRVAVERFARRGEDWLLTTYNRLEDVIRLDSVACELRLADIYELVPFPTGG